MKLYCHPASTTSRQVMLFAAEHGIPLELKTVDLFTGAHHEPAYAAINPSKQVPVLEDGEFVMTESSAILKYLAEKVESPLYPRDLQKRARINERMDWINTQLSRELGYGLIYPQLFPHHKRRSSEAQEAQLHWGKERANHWFSVLDTHILTGKNWIAGEAITIADYYAAPLVALAEIIGSDLSKYPNVSKWLGRMKELKSWKPLNEAIDGFGASLKGTPMVSL
jgi:glutathione S-transferase